MSSTETPSLSDRNRLLAVLALATVSAVLNYGDQVQSLGDAVVWFSLFVIVGYPLMTVLAFGRQRLGV
ncbi:hypothetical protein [Haloarchaeobius sp. HME9146]|uniref:hypothetical protein n=1 Tax=Haloarchaeobius sp. HME9146 TaxID=2978732 RepID=UPI0021C1A34C|nr:hypothetical protein [Haloarchaeobius sp. HME9146]MCT9094643.1 hypothetical protein [Haloarchaeobius sp. HME9146]